MKMRILALEAAAAIAILCGTFQRGLAQEDIDESTTAEIERKAELAFEKEFELRQEAFEKQARALELQARELEQQKMQLKQQKVQIDRQVIEATKGAAKQAAKQAMLVKQLAGEPMYVPFGHISAGAAADDGSLRSNIRKAATAIREAKDDEARADATNLLGKLLDQYFEEDMKVRTSELEAIAARLARLQAHLDRRREKKQEIIELQLKLVQNEADGLGLFGEGGGFGQAVHQNSPMGVEGGMGRGRSFGYGGYGGYGRGYREGEGGGYGAESSDPFGDAGSESDEDLFGEAPAAEAAPAIPPAAPKPPTAPSQPDIK